MSKLIVILTILLVGVSCTKFEEGPGFSIRTKKSRLIGEWELVEYMVDGADSLYALGYDNLKWRFTSDKCTDCRDNFLYSACNLCGGSKYNVGRVDQDYVLNVRSSRYNLKPFMHLLSDIQTGTLYQGRLWVFKRLTNSEIVLEPWRAESSSFQPVKEYRLRFRKTEDGNICGN